MVPKSVSTIFNWCLAFLIAVSLVWGACGRGKEQDVL